jgi:uncharacterized heparinase superfamily protein
VGLHAQSRRLVPKKHNDTSSKKFSRNGWICIVPPLSCPGIGGDLVQLEAVHLMSGVSIADRSRLAWLTLRRRFDGVIGRLCARVPMITRRSERLLIAPQDLRTADPNCATEIYSGRFAFAGKIVICDGRSPFEMAPPSEDWADMLLGFGWLRHLRAAETALTRANARALVDDWIGLQGSWHPLAWQPEILSRRIIAWLAHSPLILGDADAGFYRRFLRTLTRQIRYLRSTANCTRDGIPRLRARIALTCAALSLSSQTRHLERETRHLADELERQVLPDGCHITRNPGALIEMMLDLLPLNQLFASRNVAPPPALLYAIDRVMPMLRFFRHGDGQFALFNGMGPTHPDLVAAVLAYDDAQGAPVANAPHSGYQRLDAGDTVLIMDTGRPPPVDLSAQAHAGCLSFELSTKHRIIVNCGVPEIGNANWREVARATAAHSTVTFNDTSSCRFLETQIFRRLFGTPIVDGPRRVAVSREDRDNGLLLRTSHDGYLRRFGLIHQRILTLPSDGNRLEGEDLFYRADDSVLPNAAPDAFAMRFHLHPEVQATQHDSHSVALILPNMDVWNFNAYENEVALEESVYLAGPDGPRRTHQLVIVGHARKTPRVPWCFMRGHEPLGAKGEPREGVSVH